MDPTELKVAVVIPCYRVRKQILSVLESIGPEVSRIYVVDDACPEKTADFVSNHRNDPRIQIIRNKVNQGVGGATLAGYLAALQENIDIIVKLDGDGQMDPAQIPNLVEQITNGDADYVKGNRFYNLESLSSMPKSRVFGNTFLSFLTKATSGYWDLMDPTNGFTAIHSEVLRLLQLDKIERRYYFESDMLFRLNTIRAVVREIPMDAKYGSEKSNMNLLQVAFDFPSKLLTRFLKRIFYNYFLRDFNACSIQLILGSLFFVAGTIFGLIEWYKSISTGEVASTGTVMLAALPVILGFQMLLSVINYDATNIPRIPLIRALKKKPTYSIPRELHKAANE